MTGNIFYGLRAINQHRQPDLSPEVTALLLTLTQKIKSFNSDTTLHPSKLSMCLFGLQNFVCEISEDDNSHLIRNLLEVISHRVAESAPGWSGRAVGSAFFGLRGISSDFEEARNLLSALLNKFDSEVDDIVMNPQEISNSLYGMQRMDCSRPEVADILGFLRDKLMTSQSRLFKAQEISNSLYGIRKMSSSEPEVRNLICVLTEKMMQCNDTFSGQELGISLYGLQNMTNDCDEVNNLLEALLKILEESPATMSSQEISNALYGLRNMDSADGTVLGIIRRVTGKLELCSDTFKANEICMAIYGMQSMGSDAVEVKSLIRALNMKLRSCVQDFNAQNVSNALYGLQNMSSSDKEVRTLLKNLNSKIKNCSEALNGQNVGNALYGLQDMSDDFPEVRSLLSSLGNLFARSLRSDLSAQAMGNAMYGLHSMSSNNCDVLHVMEQLRIMFARSSHMFDGQSLSDALYGLRNMTSDSCEVKNLLGTFAEKIRSSDFGEGLRHLHVAKALSGMQNMSGDDIEVQQVLEAIFQKCKSKLSKDTVWTPEYVGTALYGLKNMNSEQPQVQKFLSYFYLVLSSIETPFTVVDVSKILFSMKEKNGNSFEIKNIIKIIGQQIKNVNLDGQAVENCLYGLQSTSCADPEVREFLQLFSDKIEATPALAMTPQEIANALYGLKSMTVNHEEVLKLLSVLCDATANCKYPFDAHALSTAFAGLRGCHDKHVEVTDMLFVLKQRLETFKGGFTPAQIKNIFSGLRGMTSRTKFVQQILLILSDKLNHFPNQLDLGVVSEVLYGMQRMNVEHAEVRSVLKVLNDRFPLAEADSSKGIPGEGLNTDELYFLSASLYGLASISQIHLATTQDQSIGHIMDRVKSSGLIFHLIDNVLRKGAQYTSALQHQDYQMKRQVDVSFDAVDHNSISASLLRALNFMEYGVPQLPSSSSDRINLIRSSVNNIMSRDITASNIDREPDINLPRRKYLDMIFDELQQHFKNDTSVTLEKFSILETFDADIVVKVFSSDDGEHLSEPTHVLNIEIEGYQHNYPTKRRFAFLRDRYLQSMHDVEVHRIPFDQKDIENTVTVVINNVTSSCVR